MIDDGRARLDHLGRLVLTGLGMGGLVGATTSAVVMLAAGEAEPQLLLKCQLQVNGQLK